MFIIIIIIEYVFILDLPIYLHTAGGVVIERVFRDRRAGESREREIQTEIERLCAYTHVPTGKYCATDDHRAPGA